MNIYSTADINLTGIAGAMSSILDMDSQQFNFDSADLADFGANLSANLSTGLSISDSIQVSISTLDTHKLACTTCYVPSRIVVHFLIIAKIFLPILARSWKQYGRKE